MSKILSDELYEQAGKEIDEKLEPMQTVIFNLAKKKTKKTQYKYFIYLYDCKNEETRPVIDEGYEDEKDHVNFKKIKEAKNYVVKTNKEMCHTFFTYYYMKEKSKNVS